MKPVSMGMMYGKSSTISSTQRSTPRAMPGRLPSSRMTRIPQMSFPIVRPVSPWITPPYSSPISSSTT